MSGEIGPSLANGWLDDLDGVWVALHVGDPGAAGTSSPAADTTRKQPTWNAAASASKATSGTVSWDWTAADQTITHVSLWSASVAGTFRGSTQLTVARAVSNGVRFNLTGLTATVGPLAA